MRVLLILLFVFCYHTLTAQQQYMIVGTYDSPESKGIHVFRFDAANGSVTPVSHIASPNPSFVAVSPDERFVYAVHETAPQDGKGGEIAAFTFNKQNGTLTLLNKQLSGGDHPCHVEVDKTGKWVFASNYSSGSLSVLPVQPDGSLGKATVVQHTGNGPHPQRQKGPHVHGAFIAADNKQLLVTDLGTDKIMLYDFDAATGVLAPSAQPYMASPAGSGPRILSWHPQKKFAYVIEELTGTVSVYRYKNKQLKFVQQVSTMPPGENNYAGSAFVEVSPDGKFLYASNRANVNSIAIFRVDRKTGQLETTGMQREHINTPRNFSIDPSGRYMLCENQGSNEIVIFTRDKKTGLLQDTGQRVKIGKPVCIKWISGS